VAVVAEAVVAIRSVVGLVSFVSALILVIVQLTFRPTRNRVGLTVSETN